MERTSERKASGTKAALIAGALAVDALIAACQPAGAVESQKPTTVPGTESPVPSLVTPAPSESATPSFEVSPTPSASTEASPSASASEIPFGDFNSATFLNDLEAGGDALAKYNVPITPEQLQTAYDNLMASPAAPKNQYFPVMFKDCLNPKSDKDTKLTECMSVTGWALTSIHQNLQSPEAHAFGMAMAQYDVTKVYKGNLGLLIQGVKNVINNF